jgi:hypothetical protein
MRFKSPLERDSGAAFAFIKYFDDPESALAVRRSSEKYSFGKDERVLFRDSGMPGPTDVFHVLT